VADLWERIKPDGTDRINIHLMIAAQKAYYVHDQDATKGATVAKIKTALNNQLTGQGSPTLTAGENNDLDDIATQHDAQPNINAKQTYVMLVEWIMTAAELGEVNETQWRNELGI